MDFLLVVPLLKYSAGKLTNSSPSSSESFDAVARKTEMEAPEFIFIEELIPASCSDTEYC